MCSSRWEIPACSSVSTTEPVSIRKPSATERTPGTRSVTTLTPESSVVIRWSDRPVRLSASVAVAAMTRAARPAIAVAPPATALGATTVGGRAPLATAPSPAACADPRELLDGLAGDVRVVGEAQADAAALAIDLDDANFDLIALVEDVLDRLHALAGRDVGDVQQAVRALGELDEGSEGGRLDDLAVVLVADLDLLHHHPDALHERVAELAVGRVDQHLAVVVDVDLRFELVGQAADRFATLADQQADLRVVDLDRLDARGELRELLPRSADRVVHLAEDQRARLLRLGERVAQDVEGDARDLYVHLQRRDAAIGAGDLEVHVAEVILDAGDVGQHDVVVALFDQAHRDPRDGALDRHARVHQRQRGATHRGHRGGAV